MARSCSGRGVGARAVRLGLALVTVAGLATACSDESFTAQPLPPDAAPSTTASPSTRGIPSTTATTTARPATPAGFTGFTSTDDGFSLAVPADWRQVDPSSPGAARAMEELVKSNARLGQALQGTDLAAQGIKFLAVDQSGASVNVVVKPALGAVDSDLPALVDEIKAQYAKLGATVRSNETVQLSGHAALRLTIDLRLNQPDGSRATMRQVQYFLLANDQAYIITMAGDSPHFPAIANTFAVG